MVSVIIHNLTSRIFIDFLVSHQLGRADWFLTIHVGLENIVDYTLAIFQGCDDEILLWGKDTVSVYTDRLYFLPEFLSLSTSYLFKARLHILIKVKVSQKFGQVSIWHRPKIIWVWGFLCSSFSADLFVMIFFSKKLIYFLRLKVMKLINLFWEEGCVLNMWKMDLLKMSPLWQ